MHNWCKQMFFLVLCQPLLLFSEAPWGKDVDLLTPCQKTESQTHCKTPIIGTLGEALIRFHQEVISPADGPRSHFIPSSSQYTLDAMRRYNFFTGVMMGCDRLMRENQERWVYRTTLAPTGKMMKWDPVP